MKKTKQLVKAVLGEHASERDYRALLAVTLTLGLIVILLKGDLQAATMIGPLTGSAIGWYFGGCRRR